MASVMKFTFSDILYIFRHFQSSFPRQYHGPFCSQSTHWQHFSVSICSIWGCVDQCTVDYLFFLFPFGILSVLRGKVCGLLVSNKSSLSVLLGFFTSKVNMLLIYSFFLEVFLDQSGLLSYSFGYICFFLASTQYNSQSVADVREFFKTRIHACHHCLVF